MSNIIKQLEQEQLKQNVPSFRPGDTLRKVNAECKPRLRIAITTPSNACKRRFATFNYPYFNF